MGSRKDLVNLLNRIKRDEQRGSGQFYPFTIKQLSYYCNPNKAHNRYSTFTIPKKTPGQFRIIAAPHSRGFKMMLHIVDEIFRALYTPSDYAMGFAEGRSVVANADIHKGQNYVFNTDLKNFFPSISQARIWGRLQRAPLNFPRDIANILAGLCSMRMTITNQEGKTIKRFVLPQGAPTSPIITNMICDTLDRRLAGLAKRFGLKYSRYADDITFSSMHNVYHEGGTFRNELKRIITDQGFRINEEKTRLQKIGSRQEVTGIIVSRKLNVTQNYVRNIRNILYIWKQYGYDDAYGRFAPRYKAEKGHTKKGTPNLVNVISGKLLYLKMVKGEKDPIFLRLWTQYEELIKTQKEAQHRNTSIKKGTTKKEPISALHFPQKIVRFLMNFTKNRSSLKYTTHPWDTGTNKSFDSFVEKYKDQLSKSNFWNKEFFSCDKELYYIIYNFLKAENIDNKNYWSKYHLRIGYLSPKGCLREWMNNNPGKQPSEMPLRILPEEYQPKEKVCGKTLVNFDQVINIFKECIEFRGNSFYFTIKHIFNDPGIHLDNSLLDTLRGYNFYANTFRIEEAIKRIRTNIKSRPIESNVKVWAEHSPEDNQIQLHILHLGSFSDAELENNKKLILLEEGDMKDIVESLKSACDFSIESRFRNNQGELQACSIAYLYETEDGRPTPQPSWSKKEVLGFDYILKFYIKL